MSNNSVRFSLAYTYIDNIYILTLNGLFPHRSRSRNIFVHGFWHVFISLVESFNSTIIVCNPMTVLDIPFWPLTIYIGTSLASNTSTDKINLMRKIKIEQTIILLLLYNNMISCCSILAVKVLIYCVRCRHIWIGFYVYIIAYGWFQWSWNIVTVK